MIIDEVSHGTNFYTVELVNATSEDLAPQPLMPYVYKIIATVISQSGFELGFRLRINSQGIIEPILILVKEARNGLGYVPQMMI